MIKTSIFIAIAFGFSILAVNQSANADDATKDTVVDPMLQSLNRLRPVMDVVRQHYPRATYLAFGKKLHFEASTQLYVEKAIAKATRGQEPPLVVVRGPKKEGGVWCDIVLVKGSSRILARAEGATKREHFIEHVIYQDLIDTGHHLQATVRVTKGDGNAKFIKDLTVLMQSYSHDFVTDD